MAQKDIFGNETKFFEKASFFNGAEFTGNVVIDGSLVQPSVWSVNEGTVYYTNGSMSVGTGSPNFSSFGSNTSGIEISDVNTNNALKVQSGSNDFYFVNTPTDNYIWGVNNVPLIFGTNHVERLRVTTVGNVGIATDATNHWPIDSDAAKVLQVKNSTFWNYSEVQTDIGHNFAWDGTDYRYITSDEGSRIAQFAGNIIFNYAPTGTAGNVLTWNESMRIDSAGRIGVNVTPSDFGSGARAIEVHSSGSVNSFLALTNSTTGSGGAAHGFNVIMSDNEARLFNRENGDMTFWTNATERLRIDNNGNITKPGNCLFSGRNTSGSGTAVGSVNPLLWTTVNINTGSHFDNTTGVFTAPVDGNYLFLSKIGRRATANAWVGHYMLLNGAEYVKQWTRPGATPAVSAETYIANNLSTIVPLSASDNVVVGWYTGYSAPTTATNENYLSIYLMG